MNETPLIEPTKEQIILKKAMEKLEELNIPLYMKDGERTAEEERTLFSTAVLKANSLEEFVIVHSRIHTGTGASWSQRLAPILTRIIPIDSTVLERIKEEFGDLGLKEESIEEFFSNEQLLKGGMTVFNFKYGNELPEETQRKIFESRMGEIMFQEVKRNLES